MVLLVGVLLVELTLTTADYAMIHDEDGWAYYYSDSDESFDDMNYRASEDVLSGILKIGTYLRLAIIFLFIIGLVVLLMAGKSYGKGHSRKVLIALPLAVVSWFVLSYNYIQLNGDYESFIGIYSGISVILLLPAIALTVYELGGRRNGLIGMVLGILSSIPLFLIDYQWMARPEQDGNILMMYTVGNVINFDLLDNLILMVIATAGIFIACLFLVSALLNGRRYVKAYSASADKPHIPEKKEIEETTRSHKPGKDMKKARRRVKTVVVAVIIVLSVIGIYWIAIRVPDIQEFMESSYEDGEKAKFQAEVKDVEIIETSYGQYTLVTFADYHLPFCFKGDRSGEYKVGESTITEVQFHKYNIDGEERVLLEELILSDYILFEEVFDGISHMAGNLLKLELSENDTNSVHITIDTPKHGKAIYSYERYEYALNRIRTDDEVIKEEYGYEFAHSNYPEKGTFLYDHSYIESTTYMRLISLPHYSTDNQEKYPSYIPTNVSKLDKNNDGDLNIGDGYDILFPPTEDDTTLDFYLFSINGISNGMKIILNWHDGPFYSIDRGTYYRQGPVEKVGVNEGEKIKISIDGVRGEPERLDGIKVWLSNAGYSPDKIPFSQIEDGASSDVVLHDTGDRITVTFHDRGENGILDEDDHFYLDGLSNSSAYELMVKDNNNEVILRWMFTGSGIESIGNYPILTISDPVQNKGNITFSLDRNQGKVTRFNLLRFNLTLPDEDIVLSLEPEREQYETNITKDDVEVWIEDLDDNEYFTTEDRITIKGLGSGTEYILEILYEPWYADEFKPYFTYNGTA